MLKTSLSLKSALPRSNPEVLIIAHRGEWAEAPENSLAAIEAAIAAGAHMVEIDVQAIADGTLVILHDETLDRTTNTTGDVLKLTAKEVEDLRLRASAGGADAPITEMRVLTLTEALEAARGRILVNIDTKYRRDLAAVAQTVADLGMTDQVLMKAGVDPDGDNSALLSAPWFGSVPFMPIFPGRPGRFAADAERIISEFAPSILEIDFQSLDDLVEARDVLETHNVRLWTNTIMVVHSLDFNDDRATSDPDAVWGTLIDAGVTAFQTDISAVLARYLSDR